MLITGARTSTLLTRLPYLPAADAYVAENGGRIFYPDTTLPTAMPLAEDSKWRKTHNATGARAWAQQAAVRRPGTPDSALAQEPGTAIVPLTLCDAVAALRETLALSG